MSRLKSIVYGIVFSILLSLPISFLFAVFYRFPIPLGGYIGGPEIFLGPHIIAIAWFFYGLFWGFPILALAGGLAGSIIGDLYKEDSRRAKRSILVASTMIAFVAVFFLAILDKIIGPW